MTNFTENLRILQPAPGVFAYYDGRIEGKRLHSEEPNWLDDGAYSLGTASYAVVCGQEALVYDTHISLQHARFVRAHLESLGVLEIEVVLSHWHSDHIAGNQVFFDCPIIANPLTALAMVDNEADLAKKDPPIAPLILPNRLFDKRLSLTVGTRRVELLQFDIHSADGTVLWLPEERLLMAGDTLEDTITYVSEPEGLHRHIADLERLDRLAPRHILPNHGRPEQIAAGGYDRGLIAANRLYLQRLLAQIDDPALDRQSLKDFVSGEIAEGWIFYFEPYERVHRDNINAVRASKAERGLARKTG
ncbi:MBL fold metallo-hydrolase [Rhizobium sp. FY34]|uniref:MBL fold metallo-hydrolase n=1 Tax=Rhizobium sp. FY34 TaxID=2562309 RepID=UPI0010BF7EF2|nr:MBL fold metallo-hydrolase [Rhizobium sp. FY34]